MTATPEIASGLEGVVAFATEIAEPDREGGALRYRGVDIEELAGRVPFEQVWGLLVDGRFEPGMPPAEWIELQDPSGSAMADLQAGLATLGPKWELAQLVDIAVPAQVGDPSGGDVRGPADGGQAEADRGHREAGAAEGHAHTLSHRFQRKDDRHEGLHPARVRRRP